jgi:copper homeostasis protein
MQKKYLEIVVDSIESALIAQENGADRLEVCADLGNGGLTPSYGFLKEFKKNITLESHVLIRPRIGDFLYTSAELNTMINDIIMVKELGYHGVVIGALNSLGLLDLGAMWNLIEAAKPMHVTLHRAFDVSENPFLIIQQCTELGISRILTSGQKQRAIVGEDLILQFFRLAPPNITIMPGGGLQEEEIKHFLEMGISNFHLSASTIVNSDMIHRNPNVKFNNTAQSDFQKVVTNADKVKKIRLLIDSFIH